MTFIKGFYVTFCLSVCLLFAGCGQNGETPGREGAPATGATAAPTSLPVVDKDKLLAIVAETAGRDQILVIDFWATWCIPCREMFGPLHEEMAAMGSDVRLISVTLDAPGEYEREAIEFLSEHHALDDAYLLTPETVDQIAVVEVLGDKWYDLVVPVVLVFGRDGELKGEFLDDNSSIEPIVARVKQLAEASE